MLLDSHTVNGEYGRNYSDKQMVCIYLKYLLSHRVVMRKQFYIALRKDGK